MIKLFQSITTTLFTLLSIFAFSQQSICSGDSSNNNKTYNVDLEDGPSGTLGSTYAWSLDTTLATIVSGNSTNKIIVDWSTTPPGTYNLTVVETNNGCVGDPKVLTVTINPKPVVTVNSPTVCEGDTITLLATPSVPGTYTYTWTVPTGATNPGDVNSFNPTIPGVYSVVITNTLTGCISDSASGTVTINPKPVVTVNSPTVCEGDTITLLATPSVPGTYTYTWTVPTGATNPGDVNSFTPTIPGVYSVVITNTLTGCISDSASGTVIINPKPVVTVNSPTVCEGDIITLLATPSVPGTYTYTWTVPTGATNPGDINSFTPTVSGVYSVVITNTLTGCISDSASGTVTIKPKPITSAIGF